MSHFPTQRDPTFGCEVWTGRLDGDGYGVVWRGRAPVKAYIVVYEASRGRIPAGKVLDHLCRNRACVALHHLELVTKAVNEQRKRWPARARRAHCPAGHDMTTNAVVTPHGGRVCRECNRAQGRTR